MASGTFLLMEIFGAAALLLWGIRMARTSVMRAHGPAIRRFLPRSLQNRFAAFFTGVAAATVLQSSTAVAIFIASLASLGVAPVFGGLAVMLGADVGSAVVAALLSLSLKNFWPLLVLVGYVLHAVYSESNSKAKQHGRFALGLGLVLAALTFMGRVSGELAGSQVVKFTISSLSGEPILAVLVLAVLTWLAHSSIAILLLLSSLVSSGVVTDPQLIVAGVLGINLGGGIPAVVLTWRQAPAARRIIVGNALFRLFGVMAGLVFMGVVAELYLRLPGQAGFRVVVLHVVFNLLLAVVFLPLLGRVAVLLEKIVPTPPVVGGEEAFGPRYIPSCPVSEAVETPHPLSALTRETLRMSDVVLSMLTQSFEMLQSCGEERERIVAVRRLDDKVDTLHRAISAFAIELVRGKLPKSDMGRVGGLLRYAANLENAGDIIDKSLLDVALRKNKARRAFSEEGQAELEGMFSFLLETMQMSAEAVMGWRVDMAELLIERKGEFRKMAGGSSENHIERLRRGVCESIETTSYHLGLVNDLQRIHTLVASIAFDIASKRGAIGTEI